MRVGIITSGYVNNDPRYLYLADSLKSIGHEVTIFNISFFSVNKAPSIIREKHSVVDIVIPEKIHKDLRNLPLLKFYNVCNNAPKTLNLPTILKIRNMDLLWGAEQFWGGVIANALAVEFNKPLVIDFKELLSDCVENPIGKILARYLEKTYIKNSVALPCVSSRIIHYYEKKFKHSKGKFVLLENSMPYLGTIPTKKKGSKIKFILSAGSLPPDRGGIELAKIWEKLNPKNAILDIRVKYLPESSLNSIKKHAKKTFGKSLNIIDAVVEDKMVETMADYDVGVIPYLPEASKNNLYCCPNKFGQYMNAGLVILASNTKNITEHIYAYNTGLVFDPLKINESAQKIGAFIRDREGLQIKKINALNFVKHEYNWDINAEKALNEILSPLGNELNCNGLNLRNKKNNIDLTSFAFQSLNLIISLLNTDIWVKKFLSDQWKAMVLFIQKLGQVTKKIKSYISILLSLLILTFINTWSLVSERTKYLLAPFYLIGRLFNEAWTFVAENAKYLLVPFYLIGRLFTEVWVFVAENAKYLLVPFYLIGRLFTEAWRLLKRTPAKAFSASINTIKALRSAFHTVTKKTKDAVRYSAKLTFNIFKWIAKPIATRIKRWHESLIKLLKKGIKSYIKRKGGLRNTIASFGYFHLIRTCRSFIRGCRTIFLGAKNFCFNTFVVLLYFLLSRLPYKGNNSVRKGINCLFFI